MDAFLHLKDPSDMRWSSQYCFENHLYPWGYPSWIDHEGSQEVPPSPSSPIPEHSLLSTSFDLSHLHNKASLYQTRDRNILEKESDRVGIETISNDVPCQHGTSPSSEPILPRRVSLPIVLPKSKRVSRILTEVSMSTITVSDFTQTTPESCRTVHPKDIKLIGCLGDSLLTGLGVSSQPHSFKNRVLGSMGKKNAGYLSWIISGEHRQNTCITGGGPGVVSVAKLVKTFSPDLVGITTTKTGLFSKGAEFNFARTGASSEQLVDQARRFIDRLKLPEYRYLMDKWKLVFIWIGANDVLMQGMSQIQTRFRQNILTVIRLLKSNMSKTILSILTLPDLSQISFHGTSSHRVKVLQDKTRLVNDILESITFTESNDVLDFAVIRQPIPSEPIHEESMRPFLSEIDQKHPNFLAQQLFAKCIWNNLFLPSSQKSTSFTAIINSNWTFPSEEIFISVD